MSVLGELGSALLGGLYTYRLASVLGGALVAVGLLVVARRRRWLDRLRRHPRTAAGVLLPILLVGASIGWYLGSPLLLSASVDEPPPIASSGSAAGSGSTSSVPSPTPTSDPTPAGTAATAVATSTPKPDPLPTAVPVAASRTGTFHGSDDFHFGRGTARLIEVAPGRFVVRLEAFAVRNGPDLYVYLSPSPNGYAAGAIELGRLKADTGNQNYPVPAGVLTDPTAAASVVIWCKQFSHLFATAPLAG